MRGRVWMSIRSPLIRVGAKMTNVGCDFSERVIARMRGRVWMSTQSPLIRASAKMTNVGCDFVHANLIRSIAVYTREVTGHIYFRVPFPA